MSPSRRPVAAQGAQRAQTMQNKQVGKRRGKKSKPMHSYVVGSLKVIDYKDFDPGKLADAFPQIEKLHNAAEIAFKCRMPKPAFMKKLGCILHRSIRIFDEPQVAAARSRQRARLRARRRHRRRRLARESSARIFIPRSPSRRGIGAARRAAHRSRSPSVLGGRWRRQQAPRLRSASFRPGQRFGRRSHRRPRRRSLRPTTLGARSFPQCLADESSRRHPTHSRRGRSATFFDLLRRSSPPSRQSPSYSQPCRAPSCTIERCYILAPFFVTAFL